MIMFPKLGAHLDLFESYCPIANVTTIEPGVLLKVFSRGIVFSLFISLSSIWRGFHVYLEIIILCISYVEICDSQLKLSL